MDLRPPLSAALAAFGVDATVTVPNGTPVETTAIWLPPVTEEMPVGADFRRAEPVRVLALPLADVPEIPRGTVVTAAEVEGGIEADWKVDAVSRLGVDHYRLVVVPYTAAS